MDNCETESAGLRFSPPGLIAWLSLFMLTFALGGVVDDRWHKIALQAGAVGLVSAVGLGSLEKARRLREKVLRDRALRERLDRRIGLEDWDVANGPQMDGSPALAEAQLNDSETPHQPMPV